MQMLSAVRLRPLGHDESVTTVDHLDELRTRLIVSLLALAVAFGVCLWQNHRLLDLINAPLAHQTQQQVREGHGPLGATYVVAQSARDLAVQLHTVVSVLNAESQQPAVRSALNRADASIARDTARLSAPPQGDRPVTLGIGEPFTTTVTVSLIFALILCLPVLIAQRRGRLDRGAPIPNPRRCGVDRRGVGRFVIPSLQRQTSDRQPRSVSVPFCAERPGCRLTPA